MAAAVDVGGESTRPGAAPVPASEEIARSCRDRRARSARLPVSVDTRKAQGGPGGARRRAAVRERRVGARVRPHVGRRRRGRRRGADRHAHARTPDTMDSLAEYRHVRPRSPPSWRAPRPRAKQQGGANRIAVDPGLDSPRPRRRTFRLLDELATIVALGYPVAVGPSRKRFPGIGTGRPVEDPDRATAVACCPGLGAGPRAVPGPRLALTPRPSPWRALPRTQRERRRL